MMIVMATIHLLTSMMAGATSPDVNTQSGTSPPSSSPVADAQPDPVHTEPSPSRPIMNPPLDDYDPFSGIDDGISFQPNAEVSSSTAIVPAGTSSTEDAPHGHMRGRYKAVEDFLGHCVEAYAGMPKLLFKWLASDKPKYFFEFLDNSVAKGTYPELIARGTQGRMQIYRPKSLIDIERFQRINVLATSPEQVAAPPELRAVEHNLGFLRQCIARFKLIEFIDEPSDRIYLEIRSGSFEIRDAATLNQRLADDTLREIIELLAPDLLTD